MAARDEVDGWFTSEALSDIDNAIRLGPDNPNLREWQAKIRAMK